MMSQMLFSEGSHHSIGLDHGEHLQREIENNLTMFWRSVQFMGYDRKTLIRSAMRNESLLRPGILEEIDGLAKGAGKEFQELLAYNLYNGIVFPDECTVLFALGEATASKETVFLKNSDKVGGATLSGLNFYKNKEINVILAVKGKNGNRIIGPAAAGSTGLKMGMNDKGVCVGTNIARTEELASKKVDLTTLRAIDRAQLARDALEKNTAMEAAQLIVAEVMKNPMSTPGNMELVDAKEGIIMEGSYDRTAVETVKNTIASRSNCFVLMKDLNKWDDVSSQSRYVRTQQLLRNNFGKIDRQKMIEFSMDHENGPGPNSICRHGTTPEEETSLAAAVMEVNSKQPEKSLITLMIGKPCHSWRNPKAHVTLSMDVDPKTVPQGLINGDIFKEVYTEEVKK